MTILMRQGLVIHWGLTAIFALHRFFSFPILSQELTGQKTSQIAVLATSLLSDFWIAGLVMLVFLIVAAALSLLPQKEKSQRYWGATLLGIFGACTALHQPYVEFFHHPVIPFHLNYFYDWDFVRSNYHSALSLPSFTLLALTILLSFAFYRHEPQISWRPQTVTGFFVGSLGLMTGGHSANIHYRVQLFIPPSMQTNYLENLVLQFKQETHPQPLSVAEWKILTQLYEQPMVGGQPTLTQLYQRSPQQFHPTVVAQELKKRFQNAITAQQKPLLLTILLESARPSEFGSYQPNHQGYTPQFDAIMQEGGILFKQAFSVGNVTRGGQEAVWCGHYSGLGNSLMRDRPAIQWTCLPQAIKLANTSGTMAPRLFWYHGGRGEFDHQTAFWTKQGIQHFLTQFDFPANAAHTSWGVSDHALLQKSLDELMLTSQDAATTYSFGMILTMTNHIPWQLPTDAPHALTAHEVPGAHPSFATTAYTDFALGEFFRGLKAAGLWDQAIILVMSDHGIIAPAPVGVPMPDSNISEYQLSHIVAGLTGGLVTATTHGILQEELQPVSQAAFAPFLGYLLDVETNFPAFPVLDSVTSPVIANFGDRIYLPTVNRVIPKSQVITPPENLQTESSLIYYRGYMHYLQDLER